MSDEPTLPRYPHIVGSRKRARPDIFDGSGNSSGSGNGSGSAADLAMLNNSSDPAVFSSDDDPALDNYIPDPEAGGRIRKKKRYVGAWFAQHPASGDSAFDEDDSVIGGGGGGSGGALGGGQLRHHGLCNAPLISSPLRPKRRPFERQFDSGVWMDKDASGVEAYDADEAADEAERARMALESSPPPPSQTSTSSLLSLAPPLPPPDQSDFPPPPPRQRRVFQRVSSLAVNSAEQKARVLVQNCIEAGDEKVSLIGLGLTSLSNATIEPLSGLVPIPVVAEDVAFEQKDPNLKLFLSSNKLASLPGALFSLEHLTVLSLRGNGLAELPPAIGKLRNLKSLNVSLNALRTLPAELLPLIRATGQGGRLTELLVHPNRYFRHDEADSTARRRVRQAGSAPWRVARTPVCYKDSYGNIWSAFDMKPQRRRAADENGEAESEAESGAEAEAEMLATEDMSVAPAPPWPTLSRKPNPGSAAPLTASRVPTLLEIALAACYKAPQLPQLADMLPSDAPLQISRQLYRAVDLRDSGGCGCCVCGAGTSTGARATKPLVAAMTEWVEWWEFAQSDINISYSSTAAAAVTRADEQADEQAEQDEQDEQDELGSRARVLGSRPRVLTADEIEVLPFSFRGCSWGCVPSGGAPA